MDQPRSTTPASLYVGQGSGSVNSSRRAILDLSGLETFSATLSRVIIGRQNPSTQPNRPQGTLKLARNNTLVLGGTPGILLGEIITNNGAGEAQVLELGTANTTRSDTGMTIGGRKGNGALRFNSSAVTLGTGTATFRNLAGTGRQANWLIGDNSTQDGGGTAATGVVDFSLYGEVDALVSNIIVGRATGGTVSAAVVSQGTLTFDKGVIDTNSLSVGIQPNSAQPGNVIGTVNANGTAKLRVNNSLTLVNNIANNSVDLNIIDVFSNKWSGDVSGGNWDINTTANWKLTPGNTPNTYLQPSVPGEPVTFDDTASGTKTVNLNTTLSPSGTIVDTAQTYTFSGTGALSGPGGLIKRGSGSLVIGNSGTNDFTGGINIEAGEIRIAGGNDRLSMNASVTLADEASAELDLNNLNQSLASLNGGGTTGGTVNLGTGTLTITGAGSYAGVIQGGGTLVKSGTGTLTLSGANTYSGGTNFEGSGVLALAHSGAAGSGTIHFATTQTGTAATFTLSGGIDVANPIQMDAATGRNTINSLGTINNTLSGNITINNTPGNFVVFNNAAPAASGTTFTVGATPASSTTITAATFSSVISFRASSVGELGILNSRIDAPLAGFNINNNGSWMINSTGNAWAVTSLSTNGSRIQLGANDALATGARVEMNASSSIDLNGFNQTVAGLGGTGTGARVRNDSASADSILTLSGLTEDRNFLGGIIDGDNGRKTSLVMNDSSIFSQTLTGASSYSGDTTVSSGTLILAASNPGNESSTVTIAPTGATLALNFDGSDTVDKLFIGTTQLAAGTYGPTATNIPQITSTGTGTLIVTSGPSSGGFAGWQSANSTATGFNADHDHDGVTNGIEYFIGGTTNTTGFTPLPGVTNTGGTLSVTWPKGSGYSGSYNTDFWVETSATLTGPWTKETGITIADDPGFVKFTFPNPLGTKKFARLVVTGP